MKKTILYTAIILLLTIIIVSVTYAFFASTANFNEINFNVSKFEVIYTGGKPIDGELKLAKSKEEGFNTTVNIKVAQDSVVGKADLYINIEKITDTIANDSLIWEVYVNDEEEPIKEGTFADCKNTDGTKKACESQDKLYILEDYQLSTTNAAFTIYIWLNGYKASNEVIGAELKAYIGAQSENITGNLR